MCSSDAVVNVANREVNGVIRLLTGRNRDSCLVTAEYDGDEHRSVCCGVGCNDILNKSSAVNGMEPAFSYALVPGPVPTHEVAIPAFLVLKVTVRSVVNT